MYTETPETEELIERAGRGDDPARQALLARHRARLRRMVAVRMDPVLAARVDPSDVVQEVLVEAHRTLDGYLQRPSAAVLPLAASARLGAAGQALSAPRPIAASGACCGRGPRSPAFRISRPWLWRNGWWPSGTSPSRHLLRAGAARPGPCRDGGAGRARSRGPGPAVPGGALDGRDGGRPGDQRGGRQVAA